LGGLRRFARGAVRPAGRYAGGPAGPPEWVRGPGVGRVISCRVRGGAAGRCWRRRPWSWRRSWVPWASSPRGWISADLWPSGCSCFGGNSFGGRIAECKGIAGSGPVWVLGFDGGPVRRPYGNSSWQWHCCLAHMLETLVLLAWRQRQNSAWPRSGVTISHGLDGHQMLAHFAAKLKIMRVACECLTIVSKEARA